MSLHNPDRQTVERNYHYQLESVQSVKDDEGINSPLIRKCFQWWDGFKPALPTYEAYDAFPHPALGKNMFHVKVLSPSRFQFMQRGKLANKILGGSNNNLIISADETGVKTPLEKEHLRLARYYASIVASRQCSLCKGTLLTINFMDIAFESIDCPIANSEGLVSDIIGLIDTNPSNLILETDTLL